MSELAAVQESLVRALVAGGAMPDGFDRSRLELTRAALLSKRAQSVASHWPALGAMPGFLTHFEQWASARAPAPAHDEGRAFARWLGERLPAVARVEQVLAGHGRVARDADGSLLIRWPLLGPRRIGR